MINAQIQIYFQSVGSPGIHLIRSFDLNNFDQKLIVGRDDFAPQYFAPHQVDISSIARKYGQKIAIAQWAGVTDKISGEHFEFHWLPELNNYRGFNRGRNGSLIEDVVGSSYCQLDRQPVNVALPAKDPRIHVRISYPQNNYPFVLEETVY